VSGETKQAPTPGPWEVAGHSNYIRSRSGGFAVAHAEELPGWEWYEGELNANAHLIAAAPELLAALRAARDLLASLPADLVELETMAAEDTACKMIEAIAKAEGGGS